MDDQYIRMMGYESIYKLAWQGLANMEIPYFGMYIPEVVQGAFSYIANGTRDDRRITEEANLEWMCQQVGGQSEIMGTAVSMKKISITKGIWSDECKFELVSPSGIRRVSFEVGIRPFKFIR